MHHFMGLNAYLTIFTLLFIMSARKSKQRQIALKKLSKAEIPSEKILQMAGEQVIATYFLKKPNHPESLMEMDPELLQIVLQNLENVIPESTQNPNLTKTDVLSQGKPELVVACRDKGLLSLYEYLTIRKDKNYSSHSSYGKKLVQNYPDQYYVGKKCTHYHCKTTATAIEKEYGIFNHSDSEGEDQQRKESSEFIDDGEQSEESEEQDSNQADQQQQSPHQAKSKGKKKMNFESQSQKSIKASKNKSKQIVNSAKKVKMSIEQSQHNQQDEEILLPLYQALQVLEIGQILDTIDYKVIFEYLSEKSLPKLKNLQDDISEIVQLNYQKQKKSNRKKKGEKQHKKKLTKKKQNVKEMKLQDLINQYIQREMLEEKDRQDNNFTLEDHPRLAFELIEACPDEFVCEKEFTAYEDEQINKECEQLYEQWMQDDDESDDQEEQQDQEEEQEEYQSD